MKISLVSALVIVCVTPWVLTRAAEAPRQTDGRTPVLRTTSSGCSSCPPADALLSKLDRQPAAGAAATSGQSYGSGCAICEHEIRL